MQPKTAAPFVLVALGVIFGSAFLFMKVIVEDIAVTEMVAARLALGAVTVIALMVVMGQRVQLDRRLIAGAALLAMLDSIIPYTLIAWAEIRIDSGVAAVLISTMPMFTVGLAVLVLPDERLTGQGILGLALGFLGVLVLSGGDIFELSSDGTAATLAVIGAAASYATAVVYAKVLLRGADPLGLTGTKLVLGTFIALPLTLIVEGVPDYTALSLEGSAALLALGVLTGLAFAAHLWLVKTAGSVYASLVTYIVPVSGLVLGWAVLGEEIGPATAAGAAMIAVGVTGVMHHPKPKTAVIEPVKAPRLVLRAGEG
jgi:drug/metabolite transporter (DMT)-like permease